jgi:uncharacterized protein YecT (DUF1311 family)
MAMRTCSLLIAGSVFAGTLLLATGVQAQSSDCEKGTPTERLMCDDFDLKMLDSELNGAYQGALDRSNHPDQVRTQERAWLKQRDACTGMKCLMDAYHAQIALLQAVSDEPPTCESGTTPDVDACGAEYSRRADLELARYVAAARRELLKDAASDPQTNAAKDALTGLDVSQTAWVAYRKAECEAIYSRWSDGTIRGAMFNGCYLSVTKARTQTVWANWLTYEDDTPPILAEPSKK